MATVPLLKWIQVPMNIQPLNSKFAEEISIFCPVRFYLGSRHFDGLLDTLDSKGGTFFILTEDEQPHHGTPIRESFQSETKGDLVIGRGGNGIRIPCRVRGMRIDEDGLYAYIGLQFLIQTDREKKRLEEFISSLW
jgi:hypothetical protein